MIKIVTTLIIRPANFLCAPIISTFSQQSQKKYFFKIKNQVPQKTPVIYPKQYPTNLVDSGTMIPRGRPTRFLSPKDQIPQRSFMSHDDIVLKDIYKNQWKSPENAYKLNVGLIGPVNSGKSQLMARLSHKVSAVSPKNNTTDEVVHAFKSLQMQTQEGIRNIQLKYFDTPGLMHHKTGFLSKGWKVLGDIDFSLLVIDSSKKFDDLLQESINRLEKHRKYEHFMKALVLNKIDLVENKRKFHGLISQIEKYGKFDKIFYTSALTGYGVNDIEQYLAKFAEKGEWEHPKEARTDSTEVDVAQQMLKQALYHRTYNQVPYNTFIQCEAISRKSDGTHFVQFRLLADDQNIQRMIIGKKGRNIQWICNHFKTNYAKTYGVEVQVHVRVVIRKKRFGREMQDIESSYYQQKLQQQMKIMRQNLQREGKFIK